MICNYSVTCFSYTGNQIVPPPPPPPISPVIGIGAFVSPQDNHSPQHINNGLTINLGKSDFKIHHKILAQSAIGTRACLI